MIYRFVFFFFFSCPIFQRQGSPPPCDASAGAPESSPSRRSSSGPLSSSSMSRLTAVVCTDESPSWLLVSGLVWGCPCSVQIQQVEQQTIPTTTWGGLMYIIPVTNTTGGICTSDICLTGGCHFVLLLEVDNSLFYSPSSKSSILC